MECPIPNFKPCANTFLHLDCPQKYRSNRSYQSTSFAIGDTFDHTNWASCSHLCRPLSLLRRWQPGSPETGRLIDLAIDVCVSIKFGRLSHLVIATLSSVTWRNTISLLRCSGRDLCADKHCSISVIYDTRWTLIFGHYRSLLNSTHSRPYRIWLSTTTTTGC